ncbi:BTB/POZ domain-containing protein 6-like [Biomphalaria glabrata]|uniref:BTB/POZ domain-containing protein 6-like n=1 Tax=Biomphalaria glabrata TaxID=6526 RepID=A0A9W2ZF07_BIOGL|nr:BTB/POZ domain-containing protein 6-like [Biomphalaria glabrata]
MELKEDWQNCDDVLKGNQLMLEHQYACDIHFLLGEAMVRQGAHKFVLISRSPVFDAMLKMTMRLQGSEGEEVDIPVPDIDHGTFLLFLRYLYYGFCDLTPDNVINLLYCAKKYACTGLVKKCLDYAEDLVDPKNACALLEQAHFFDEKEFGAKILSVVLRKSEEVLVLDDVTQLCETCLGKIVESDKLMAKEETVFAACKKWAEAECGRRGLAVTDANCRIMLGSTLYKIRFPLLSPKFFVSQLAQSCLLSEEEKVDVMAQFIVPKRASSFFSKVLRTVQRHLKFNRFQERSEAAFNNRSGSNAICFQVNQDIILEGFSVYGPCRGSEQELLVEGRVLGADDETLTSVEATIFTSGKQDIYDVMLDQPVRLYRGVNYTLLVDIKGSHTFAGQKGRLSALCNDTLFAFSHSDKSLTGTTTTHGQLPGLIFSR